MTRTVAILLAAGSGHRFGGDTPKQFIDLAGRPVFEHSLLAFGLAAAIDEIVVVVSEEHRDSVRRIIAAGNHRKVSDVILGGRTRLDSTRAAIAHVGDADGYTLIHDAARPLVTQATISDCLVALAGADAVATVVRASDTIVRVDGKQITETLDRGTLRHLQTPQAFRAAVLAKAVIASAAAEDSFDATDDVSLVRHFVPDARTTTVDGSPRAFKITGREDLAFAAALLEAER